MLVLLIACMFPHTIRNHTYRSCQGIVVAADGIVFANAPGRSFGLPNSFADCRGMACWMITDTVSQNWLWMYPCGWEKQGPRTLSNSSH